MDSSECISSIVNYEGRGWGWGFLMIDRSSQVRETHPYSWVIRTCSDTKHTPKTQTFQHLQC